MLYYHLIMNKHLRMHSLSCSKIKYCTNAMIHFNKVICAEGTSNYCTVLIYLMLLLHCVHLNSCYCIKSHSAPFSISFSSYWKKCFTFFLILFVSLSPVLLCRPVIYFCVSLGVWHLWWFPP